MDNVYFVMGIAGWLGFGLLSLHYVTAGNPRCVCGHTWEAHEHYRDGSDCSRCPCLKFRRYGGQWNG